ncbi:hypothetical protein ACWGHU_12720 [Streptomyces xanthophaeus]
MTILYTQLDGTQAPRPTYPQPTRPSDVYGATEPGDEARAVVGLHLAVTRDMLAVALDDACSNADDENPDDWSVEYIRESVELYLSMYGAFRLRENQNLLIDFLYSEPAGPCRDRVQAEYRAIDRAYPHAPQSGR